MKNNIPKITAIVVFSFFFLKGTIDLDNLFNYANQTVPNYITKDNTPGNNAIDDKIATLGRVLFYDKNLSNNNTIACASCHQQAFAFSDPLTTSLGLNGGNTGRHSMRLVNSRFADEVKFFWDERATSLEDQVTQPIQDHVEMGFSGTNGDPDFSALITKLSAITYYQNLFEFAFGDQTITEARMQLALAQFVRSIQSFDSKFDVGLQAANGNVGPNFGNFTADENLGKRLFLDPPNRGGAGCAGCHRPPEFDIDPNSLNNGIIGVANGTGVDLTNTRSPSLRDLVNPNGDLNGPLMHDGSLTTLLAVIDHYNAIPNNAANTNLDQRLNPPGQGNQNLNLTNDEKTALEAFLKTLTGTDVYTNEKWSDPFDSNGNINLVGSTLSTQEHLFGKNVLLYPNPAKDFMNLSVEQGNYEVAISNQLGQLVLVQSVLGTQKLDVSKLNSGVYLLKIVDRDSKRTFNIKFIKQ
ncbi:MAG: cytochrome-c peroxidase [Flavobacteriaceae bacterium]|nr:cytochrome-c peroxidase [Flavobacteriaceae bacterium]|tara:strand:- start:46837 stop:48237 length:1401 start_codon:yes stop_codon:yes gene_type:complete